MMPMMKIDRATIDGASATKIESLTKSKYTYAGVVKTEIIKRKTKTLDPLKFKLVSVKVCIQ